MTEALKLGVIGNPVEHSRSPEIFAAFGKQLGIELSYERILASADEFAACVQQFFDAGGHGLNVTLPFKADAFELAAACSEAATLAGAVNTLRLTDNGLQGDNTDGLGFQRDLERAGITVSDRRVLLLGAGGAARGIIKPLLELAPEELTVSNRNPWKPEIIAEQFASHGPIRACTHLALKGDQYDLIVNATAAGHAGQVVRLPDDVLASGGDCYDLSYGQAATPFLDWARSKGAVRSADGLGMLVEQAAESMAVWSGQRPQTNDVIETLRSAL